MLNVYAWITIGCRQEKYNRGIMAVATVEKDTRVQDQSILTILTAVILKIL